MPNYNKVFLMGNLTRDPELRMTPKGTAVAQISLAINRKFRDESGADREEVTYVDVDSFGKQAETICKYVKKGRPLFVEGRLRLDQWEDKTTKEKKSRLKIVLEQFQFIDAAAGGGRAPGGDDEGGAFERSSPPPRAQSSSQASRPANPDVEEDVPF